MIRSLSNEETKDIYNTYLVEDFPKSEVKPLAKILDGIADGKYETLVYEEEGNIKSYAFFIKSSVSNTYLLDYFAVIKKNRSEGIGSKFLKGLQKMVRERGGHLILEVENPEYEPPGNHRDYMFKRIEFYKKNGMCLSGVSCRFYGNEYRIFYGKDNESDCDIDDETIQAETLLIYNDFFGEEFIERHCEFHTYYN
ncbi:MAG: GNAT family N-acetyltransferase [Lachnospira sp.]|nr:GNAT family N-acetyltransferase [Lachnospira sp.]